jgi:hypothetical protein
VTRPPSQATMRALAALAFLATCTALAITLNIR